MKDVHSFDATGFITERNSFYGNDALKHSSLSLPFMQFCHFPFICQGHISNRVSWLVTPKLFKELADRHVHKHWIFKCYPRSLSLIAFIRFQLCTEPSLDAIISFKFLFDFFVFLWRWWCWLICLNSIYWFFLTCELTRIWRIFFLS